MTEQELVLNREHLARYTMGDAELEREILGLYVVQADENIARLLEAGDVEARGRAAHTIKGVARSLGAERLATWALRLEDIADTPDDLTWSNAVKSLVAADQEFRRLIVELAKSKPA